MKSLPYPRPSQPQRFKQATILGATVEGLLCALLLMRQGWKVSVLEEEPRLTKDLTPQILYPQSLRIFEALGLADAIAQFGHPFFSETIRTVAGKPLLNFSYPNFAITPYEAPIAIRKDALRYALLDLILQEGDSFGLTTPIHWGRKVADIQHSELGFRLTVADAESRNETVGDPQHLATTLIDARRSAGSKSLMPHGLAWTLDCWAGRPVAQSFWGPQSYLDIIPTATDKAIAQIRLHRDVATKLSSSGRNALPGELLKIFGGEKAMAGSFRTLNSDALEALRFLREGRGAKNHESQLLRAPQAIPFAPATLHLGFPYFRLGDSMQLVASNQHRHQALALAIEDAAMVVSHLIHADLGSGNKEMPSTLEAFNASRKARRTFVTEKTKHWGNLVEMKGAVNQALRNKMLQTLPSVWVQARLQNFFDRPLPLPFSYRRQLFRQYHG